MITKTFLGYVADDLLRRFGADLSRLAVVFPNKRAALFLNRQLASQWKRPLWSPAYLTVSELFQAHSQLKLADPIELVCRLFKSYLATQGERAGDETLDRFYGWGQLLLTDFDDLDKHLAPPSKVFAELKNYHALDDDPEMSDEQKKALMAFFANYQPDHPTRLKQKFEEFWSKIGDIYTEYRSQLLGDGMAYEGMLYREVAESDIDDFEFDTYAFVGFNMMQEAEKELCRKIGKCRKTLFYWDFDTYYMDDPMMEAGHYIKENIAEFGNALTDEALYTNFNKRKDINFVSAQTENVQARFIPDWLTTRKRYADGTRTAIVMCDEKLLSTVVHCLPNEVEKVNVTTGFPLQESPVTALVAQLIALQAEGNPGHRDVYRMKYVREVLGHPYARYISDQSLQLLTSLRDSKNYFPRRAELALDDGLSLLFADLDTRMEATGNQDTASQARLTPADCTNLALLQWLKELMQLIGRNARNELQEQQETDVKELDPLFQESVFRMFTLLNRLTTLIEKDWLHVDANTLRRLLTQIITTTTIPYHGEPAQGLQIMGVLETRNLDFDHLLLLSCNDGNMPKAEGDTSFIPYSVRKAYGLTTIDNKVAIYAYYFYRMIQRASDVTICYNTSTSNAQTGEMSRFMRQMLVESRHDIRMTELHTAQSAVTLRREPVAKTHSVAEYLDNLKELSPTAINTYLKCQLSFYYKYVIGIREPDDGDDEIDNRTFGSIFHKACENIYRPYIGQQLSRSEIEAMLKNKPLQERAVDNAFKTEFFNIPLDKPFKMQLNGLQLINRRVILKYVERLLRLDAHTAPLTIVALEHKVMQDYAVTTSGGTRLMRIGGIIDRIDQTAPNGPLEKPRMRVIDYKTGSQPTSLPHEMADLFTPARAKKTHGNYYLQTFLYALNLSKARNNTCSVSPALLFIRNASANDYDPVLKLGGTINDIETLRADFEAPLLATVAEILDTTTDFSPTDDAVNCQRCPYAGICGLQPPTESATE